MSIFYNNRPKLLFRRICNIGNSKFSRWLNAIPTWWNTLAKLTNTKRPHFSAMPAPWSFPSIGRSPLGWSWSRQWPVGHRWLRDGMDRCQRWEEIKKRTNMSRERDYNGRSNPSFFFRWHNTTHHSIATIALGEISLEKKHSIKCMYLWQWKTLSNFKIDFPLLLEAKIEEFLL